MAQKRTDQAVEADLAARLLEHMQSRDVEGMRDLFSPDVIFWSNVAQRETVLEERMAFMHLEHQVFAELRIEDVQTETFDGGFVQQSAFCGSLKNGPDFRIPGCLVVRIKDGRIVRFEEYVSDNQTQPVKDAIFALLAEQGAAVES